MHLKRNLEVFFFFANAKNTLQRKCNAKKYVANAFESAIIKMKGRVCKNIVLMYYNTSK